MKIDHPDIEYILEQPIGQILIKGLAQTFLKKPKFPIDFLSKWLLNYNQTIKQEKQTKIRKREIKDFKISQEQKIILQEQQIQTNNDKQKQNQILIDQYLQMVKENTYSEELLDQSFPEFIKNQFNLTGVYLAQLTFPQIEFDAMNDDQYAHLDQNLPKVIKYIGSDIQHEFMKQISVSQEQGINSKLFKVEEQAEEGEQKEQQDYIYVDNVVQEPKMHFFKFPKLGAYMSVLVKIQNILSEQTFNQSLEERTAFKKLEEQYQKDYEEKERSFNEQREALMGRSDNPDDMTALDNQFKEEIDALNKPQQKPFAAQEQQYIFCFDTLNQDRPIIEEERKKILQHIYFFRDCWEQNQNKILSINIENQINYYEVNVIQELIDQLNNDEQSYIADNQQNIAQFSENEQYYNYRMECLKLDSLKTFLQTENFQKSLSILIEFRSIKYQIIIQTILFQLKYSKADINIKSTNILNWKKISQMMPQIIEQLINYSHFDAKIEVIENYMKLNKQISRVQNISTEEVQGYSFSLSILLKLILMILKLRKQEIEIRKIQQEKMKQDRLIAIQASELYYTEFQRLKSEQIALNLEAIAQDPETSPFNEEQWQTDYQNDNPPPFIPDEVIEVIDIDIETE